MSYNALTQQAMFSHASNYAKLRSNIVNFLNCFSQELPLK